MKIRSFILGVLVGILGSAVLLLVIQHSSSQNSGGVITLPAETPLADNNQEQRGEIEGKINLNTASADELESLPGIGPARAAAIIKFRTQYGPLESLDEVLYIQGFSESLLAEISSLVYVK